VPDDVTPFDDAMNKASGKLKEKVISDLRSSKLVEELDSHF
jgi:hypothetical protein